MMEKELTDIVYRLTAIETRLRNIEEGILRFKLSGEYDCLVDHREHIVALKEYQIKIYQEIEKLNAKAK